MIDYFRERAQTLQEALTRPRVLWIGAIVSVAMFVFGLFSTFFALGSSLLTNVTAWGWSLAIGLALGTYFVFEYSHRLRMQLVPKVRPYFDAERNGIVQSPEKVLVQGEAPNTVLQSEHNTSFIRIHIETRSKATVKECSVYVKNIAKKRVGEGAFAAIPLSYPVPMAEGITIYPNLPRPVDFLRSKETTNNLRLAAAWPLTLRNAFNDLATYRFTLSVVGGNDMGDEVVVDVDWTGRWDTIAARQVA